MTAQIIEQFELFSEAELETLEFLPEELESIEAELIPDLESISPEKVAKDLEAYFDTGVLEGNVNSTGRKKAVEVTSKYQSGTVGAVVHTAVTPFAKWFGDAASGNIGDHYASSDEALKKEANDTNIAAFAKNETEWWKHQDGVAGRAGKLLSADQRTTILKCVRDKPKDAGSCASK